MAFDLRFHCCLVLKVSRKPKLKLSSKVGKLLNLSYAALCKTINQYVKAG